MRKHYEEHIFNDCEVFALMTQFFCLLAVVSSFCYEPYNTYASLPEALGPKAAQRKAQICYQYSFH